MKKLVIALITLALITLSTGCATSAQKGVFDENPRYCQGQEFAPGQYVLLRANPGMDGGWEFGGWVRGEEIVEIPLMEIPVPTSAKKEGEELITFSFPNSPRLIEIRWVGGEGLKFFHLAPRMEGFSYNSVGPAEKWEGNFVPLQKFLAETPLS